MHQYCISPPRVCFDKELPSLLVAWKYLVFHIIQYSFLVCICVCYNFYFVINYFTCSFFLLFCWQCISIHLCNKNQLDAPFTLSLFRHSASTCFGHICSPSSGGILHIYSNWYVLCFSVDRLLAARLRWNCGSISSRLQICPKRTGWLTK